MKHFILLSTFTLIAAFSFAQEEKKEKLYHPEVDASAQIATALTTAKSENKHIILQLGGNWCGWCYRFHDFCKDNESVKEVIDTNFIIIHVNFSKENKNEDLLKKYKYPQRFGFPVLIVLNADGEHLHTQDSGLLEAGKGYDEKKVVNFLKGWSPAALDEASY